MAKLSRNLKFNLSKKAVEKITKAANEKIYEKIAKVESDIENRIRKELEEVFRNSVVIRGIEGAFSDKGGDLQAELGLRDEWIPGIIERFIQIILATVKAEVSRNPSGKFPITVQAKYLNSDEYENELINDENFSYQSQSTHGYGKNKRGVENEVPWMQWLLRAKELMIDGYGITYNLSERGKGRSRSGRALMTSSKNRSSAREGKVRGKIEKNFPYRLPKETHPKKAGSRNFIEDVALDTRFQAALTRVVEKAVYRRVSNNAKLPTRLKG